MAYMKQVTFTHTVYEKGIAIAHIKHINTDTDTIRNEWAVVSNPVTDSKDEYYGTWHFSYRYCSTYGEAKEFFVAKVNEIRQNRGEDEEFYLA